MVVSYPVKSDHLTYFSGERALAASRSEIRWKSKGMRDSLQ